MIGQVLVPPGFSLAFDGQFVSDDEQFDVGEFHAGQFRLGIEVVALIPDVECRERRCPSKAKSSGDG